MFKYTHQEVGEFLGYPEADNYRSLVNIIKGKKALPSVFANEIDYKVCLDSKIQAKNNNDNRGGQN